jgi:hypothetical protein
MLKKSFHLGTALILALVFVFAACKGPVGPAGESGADGETGTTGTTGNPGSNWADPGVTFTANVLSNDLAIAFALSNKVTVDATASALTLTGVVPSGKTLNIKGANGVTINTGDLTVKNGGTLEVISGGALIADTAKTLVVEPTATVTVKSGGVLGSAAAIEWTASSAATLIKAKSIGGFDYSEAGTLTAYGDIVYEDGAAYYTKVASAADVDAAKGFTVADRIVLDAGVAAGNDATVRTALTSGKALYVKGSYGFTSGSIAIDGDLWVTGNVTQNASGNGVTVTGSLTVEGTYTAIVAIAAGVQYIDGTGVVQLGTLSIVADNSTTTAGFGIQVVNADNPATVGDLVITGKASSTTDAQLLLDGAGVSLVVTGTATLTKNDGDATIDGGGNDETIIFKNGSTLASSGSPTLNDLVVKAYTADTTYTWGGAAWAE